MNRSETKLYSQTQRQHNLTTEHCDGTKGQSLIPNHSLSVKAETYSYLDGHVSHIRILWALHEDERWVSCVLYYHLVCYFIRRWGESIEQWLTPSFSQIQFMHSNEVFYSCSIDFEVHLSNYILFFSPQPQKQLTTTNSCIIFNTWKWNRWLPKVCKPNVTKCWNILPLLSCSHL